MFEQCIIISPIDYFWVNSTQNSRSSYYLGR